MCPSKFCLTLLLLFLSVNAMSRSFSLSNEAITKLKSEAGENEYIKRNDFKNSLISEITQEMGAKNWSSENFPSGFADIILQSYFGKEIELQGAQLESLISGQQISNLYNNLFKEVVKVLAKELEQDPKDLAENFELYSLSYDTFYIFQYRFPTELAE